MRTVALGEIIRDARSGFASGEDTSDGVVQIRMNNVTTEGSFDWSKLRRVPPPKNLDELTVQPNDILLNATNSPDLVGKNAVFKEFSEPVTFSNHFIRIRLDDRIADSRLISRWLTDQWQRGKFKSMCRQWVNQASLNKEQLLNLPIPLPPLSDQRRIAAILDEAGDLRRKRRNILIKFETLTSQLSAEAFEQCTSWTTIGEACEVQGGLQLSSARSNLPLEVPYLRVANVYRNELDLREIKIAYQSKGIRAHPTRDR